MKGIYNQNPVSGHAGFRVDELQSSSQITSPDSFPYVISSS